MSRKEITNIKKELANYEMMRIEDKLLNEACKTYSDYSLFEKEELKNILKTVKVKHEKFCRIIDISSSILTITLGVCLGTFIVNRFSIYVIAILTILFLANGISAMYAKTYDFKKVENFLSGKAHLFKDGKSVIVSIDNFKDFKIEL